MKARPAKPVPRPDAVFVLGMHRSGTSATAGALGLLGLKLGERLLDPAPDNPKGYFEHADAVSINDGLLEALDRSWNDIRPLPQDWAHGQAAHSAEQSIAELVIGRFPPGEPWAIKDPRLCRLLPPWLRAVSRRKLRAACVLVLRHPGEVADSLALRDSMPHTASYILWLRHVLESVEGSARLPRALLRYDELVAAPGATLRAAGRQIGFEWPLGTELLESFVSSDDRHHRAPAAGDPESEWHALAMDVYSALCGRAPWTDVQPLVRDFEDMAARQSNLIESLGRTLKGAHEVNQAWSTKSIEAQAHADELQRGLQRAEHDALAARAELERMGRQLAATQEAQRLAERLSLDRLEQMATLDERLSASDIAREEIELIATTRLAELERTSLQLAETQAALAETGQLAVARLEQMAAMDKELQALAKAKTEIESMAHRRLAEAELLGAQLTRTQHALATAERMALERLEQLEATHKQLQAYATAQTAIESIATNRLEEIESMRLQLAQTQEALANATDLSVSRLAEASKLADALLDARAKMESLKSQLEDRNAELGQMQALLDESAARNLGLSEALQQARASLQKRDRTVASQEREMQAAEAAAVAYREQIEAMTQRLHAAETSLDAIRSSWRWRLAHPEQWHRKGRGPAQ